MKKIFAIFLLLALLCPLVACGEDHGEPSATHTVNGFSIELYEADGIVTHIKTVSPSGKSSPFIKCHGTDFSAVDLNFDGYDDLRLKDARNEGRYIILLYQPNSHTFTSSSALSALLDPVWNADDGTIDARILKIQYYSEREGEVSGYRETRGSASYTFVGGILTQISESGIYHDSDGELYCVYEAELVDGELVYDYGAEKWYYADELAKAGYVW